MHGLALEVTPHLSRRQVGCYFFFLFSVFLGGGALGEALALSKRRAQLDAAGCRLVGLLGEPGKRLLLQDAGAGTTHEDAGAGTTQEWVVNMAI